MAAVYPTSIKVFTTKTNKVDIVDASHPNTLQEEVVALQTYIGTNPHGNQANLTARLGNIMDTDGSVLSGAAFPSPSYPSQIFYRTDLDLLYCRDAANANWTQVGQSLSNTIFSWYGYCSATTSSTMGMYYGTEVTPNSVQCGMGFLTNKSNADLEMILSKWLKISGVATIRVNALIWAYSGNTCTCTVSIAGTNTTGTNSGQAPAWVTWTHPVAGLVNSTVYDVKILLKTSASQNAYLGAITLHGI